MKRKKLIGAFQELCCWGGILLLASFQLLLAQSAEETSTEAEKWSFATQNPILRDYFRDLYPQLYSSRFPPQPDFVESFVDRQVEHFLKEVEDDLHEIRSGIEMATKLRQRVIQNSSPGSERRIGLEAQIAFRATLRKVEDSCDDLGDNLDLIFRSLDRKKEFVLKTGSDEFFGAELEFLALEFKEAERLINDYLVSSTNTVSYSDLREENMLTRLYQAKEMAKHIREQAR